LVAYPLRDRRSLNVVAVEERSAWAEEGWAHRDDPANLRLAFRGFAPQVRSWLDSVEEVFLWGLFRHPVAETWSAGRRAIIGDAAHPTLPFLAQGANRALEDAWVVGASLARADTVPEGLAHLTQMRHKRCARIVAAAEANARVYHLRGPLRALAHMAMGLGGRLAPRAPLRRFDWLYKEDVTATPT